MYASFYKKLAGAVRNYPCLCDKSPEIKFSVRWLQFPSLLVLSPFGKYSLENTQKDLFSLFSRSLSCRRRRLPQSRRSNSRRSISSSSVIFLIRCSSQSPASFFVLRSKLRLRVSLLLCLCNYCKIATFYDF